eukprot:m.54639 g.54639  ORF g.54639 m.54639 type:complete len:241 (-) comp13638_c0_seq1:399-1121(-)
MSSDDELPTYSTVRHLAHNNADFVIIVRRPREEAITMPVSKLDTPDQLLKRLQALTGLPKDVPVRLKFQGEELRHSSADEVGMKEGDVLDLYIRNPEAVFEGPGDTIDTVTPWPEDGTEQEANSDRSLMEGELLPSYTAVSEQIRAARQEQRAGRRMGACRILFLLTATLVWFCALFACFVILPFFLITYGSRMECEGDKRVPQWMVVRVGQSLTQTPAESMPHKGSSHFDWDRFTVSPA